MKKSSNTYTHAFQKKTYKTIKLVRSYFFALLNFPVCVDEGGVFAQRAKGRAYVFLSNDVVKEFHRRSHQLRVCESFLLQKRINMLKAA